MAARRNPLVTMKSAKRKNWATQTAKEIDLLFDKKLIISLDK
jgi:hypothetical protein